MGLLKSSTGKPEGPYVPAYSGNHAFLKPNIDASLFEDDDGTTYFLFGYMNRNWEEEIDVPVGPDNDIEPGGPDQGQPTHYLPRRNRFIFKVRVPKDFGQKEMVWTLTTHGKTEKAYATLRTDYLLENVDLMSETGALGAGTSNPEVRADIPPVIRLEGDTSRSVRVGQPLSLVAVVTDDGIPKPRSILAFARICRYRCAGLRVRHGCARCDGWRQFALRSPWSSRR